MSDTQYKFDPKFDALLDEALRPDAPPEGLADRIVAATRDDLSSRRSGVIARIGRISPAVGALAATIVLAASVGVVLMSTVIVRDAKQTVDLSSEINALARYEPAEDMIDKELELLSMEIDMALRGEAMDSGASVYDDLRSLEADLVGASSASF